MAAGKPTDQKLVGVVLALLGSGKTQLEAAQLTGLPKQTVSSIVNRDQNAAIIAGMRDGTKLAAAEALEKLIPKMGEKLNEALGKMDLSKPTAKDIDALSRALLNIEKTGSSVSGENKVAPPQPIRQTITFAAWTTKSGKPETHDMLTGELLEVQEAELVPPAQLPASTAVDPDGDDDDPA